MQLLTTFTAAAAALALGEIIPWSSETPPNSVDAPTAAAFVSFGSGSSAAPFLVTGNAEGLTSFYLDGGAAPWTSSEAVAALDSRPGDPAVLVGINPVSKQLISWNFTPDGGVAPAVAPAPVPNAQSIMPLALQFREGYLYAMSAALWKTSKGTDQRAILLWYAENNAWVPYESRTFTVPITGVSDDRTGIFYGALETGSIIAGKSVTSFPSIIIIADPTKPLPDSMSLYPVGEKDTYLLVHRNDGTLEIYDGNARPRAKLLGTATFASRDGSRTLTSGNRMAFLSVPTAEGPPAGMLALYDAAEKNYKFVPWSAVASAFEPKLPGAYSVFPTTVDAGNSDDGAEDTFGTRDAGNPDASVNSEDAGLPKAPSTPTANPTPPTSPVPADAGSSADAGDSSGASPPPQGCGCSHAGSTPWSFLLIGAAMFLARRAMRAR